MVANLVLRFDEALFDGDTVPPPQTAEALATALSPELPGAPSLRPQLMDTSSTDHLTAALSIIPKAGSVELPGYRTAGKFSLTFAWKDLPIDPRAIRALGVEIYLGTVQADGFSRGMRGQLENGRLASVIATNPENLVLAGVVDTHKVSYTDKGSELVLEGRDLRGIFLDAPLAPETLKGLNTNQPIQEVVKDLLKRAPQGEKVPVEVVATDWPAGIVPSPGDVGLDAREQKGANGAKKGIAKVKGEPGLLSFWDLITNLCMLVGAMPFFKGQKLMIRTARGLYEQTKADAVSPFKSGKPRDIKVGDNTFVPINFRRMVYGRNIGNLTFERKLTGRAKLPTVLVVSVDQAQKGKNKLITAQWPDVGPGVDAAKVVEAQTTNVDPSGKAAGTNVMRISVPGIADKERLRSIARQIYEEVSRGEFSGACNSKDLASLGGDNSDADILRLRPGDAVEFLVDASGVGSVPPVISELNTKAAEPPAAAVKSLAARLGGRTDIAKVLVAITRGTFAKLQSVFRVFNVKFTWDAGSGVAVDFDFQNYKIGRASCRERVSSPV